MSGLPVRLLVLVLLLAAALVGVRDGSPGRLAPGELSLAEFDTGPSGSPAGGEAAAMAEAQSTGSPVEVTDLTTESTRVMADPAGHFVAELSPGPVRVRRDGEWVAVDPSLRADGSGRLVPVASAAEVSVSAGGAGPLVSVTAAEGEGELSLTWPEELPEPEVEGARATYRDVFPDVDLVVESRVNGFATFLVVESAKAARSPALEQVDFGLATRGVSVSSRGESELVARDTSDRVVFSTDPARMWDGAPVPTSLTAPGAAVDRLTERPDSRTASVATSVVQSQGREVLRLVPDRALLEDPETRFPVVIDPAWKTNAQQESEWGMVWSNGMDFHNSGQPPRVGYDGWKDNKKSRSFYEFRAAWFANRRIRSATLRHHQVHSPGWSCDTTDGPGVRVYRSALFGSGISWPGPSLWGLQDTVDQAHGHEDVCPGFDVNEWDVTMGFKTAVNDGAERAAFAMVSANESDRMGWRRYKYTGSNYPQLLVEYNTQPKRPTDVDLSSSSTRAARWVGSENRWYTNEARPWLAARVVDPDGDQLKFQYQVWTGSSKVWDSTTRWRYASGSKLSRRVGEGVVTVEGGYRFRIRGIDEQGWASQWSPWGFFTFDNTPPEAPTITKPEHPLAYGEGGYFRLEPGVGGAARFHYGFTTSSPTQRTVVSTQDVARRVLYSPVRFGPDWVVAQAEDLAGNVSGSSVLDFRVKGAEASHSWRMDDASAASGGMDLTLQGAPVWGEGVHRWYDPFGSGPAEWNPTDQGLELNGSDEYAQTSGPVLADTSKSFSVSAWVRLDPVQATGNYNMVVSQIGDTMAAFYLEYLPGGWSFRVRSVDGGSATTAAASSSVTLAAEAEWVHLVGVYVRPRDKSQGVVRLYVDGELAAEGAAPEGVFDASGPLRIGASQVWGDVSHHMAGVVDEVRVFPGAVDPLGALALASEIRGR